MAGGSRTITTLGFVETFDFLFDIVQSFLLNIAWIVADEHDNSLVLSRFLNYLVVPLDQSVDLDFAGHLIQDNEGFFISEVASLLSL